MDQMWLGSGVEGGALPRAGVVDRNKRLTSGQPDLGLFSFFSFSFIIRESLRVMPGITSPPLQPRQYGSEAPGMYLVLMSGY